MPKELTGAQNGKLDPALLRNVKPKGQLFKTAATAFNCLQLAGFFKGIAINPIGVSECYRTLERQETIFFERFQLTPSGRVPEITRVYKGRKYYLKAGRYAPCASPGSSNHGYGLAVDIANASGPILDFLLGDGFLTSQALRYGFSWEVASGPEAEPWHLRYVCGDELTRDALEAIAVFPDLDVR
jgi:LAS superfamily LD-carboxypeptidase LdcB